MDTQLDMIRAALQADASHDVTHQGLDACRALLASLEAKVSPTPPATAAAEPASAISPVVEPPTAAAADSAGAPPPASAPAVPDLAAVFNAVRGLSLAQLLDIAIERMRAALPPGAPAPAVTPFQIQMVPLHHLRQPK